MTAAGAAASRVRKFDGVSSMRQQLLATLMWSQSLLSAPRAYWGRQGSWCTCVYAFKSDSKTAMTGKAAGLANLRMRLLTMFGTVGCLKHRHWWEWWRRRGPASVREGFTNPADDSAATCVSRSCGSLAEVSATEEVVLADAVALGRLKSGVVDQ